MRRFSNPFDFLRPAAEVSKMMVESHQVIALRMAGMVGVWPMGSAERQRMVDEKVAALTESAGAVMKAGMTGKSPGSVAMAGLRPIRRRTKANAARLKKEVAGGGA